MSVIKTHTGIVITRDGEKRMKLHSTETSWVAGRCESYDKKTGYRWGAPNMRRQSATGQHQANKTGSNQGTKLIIRTGI